MSLDIAPVWQQCLLKNLSLGGASTAQPLPAGFLARSYQSQLTSSQCCDVTKTQISSFFILYAWPYYICRPSHPQRITVVNTGVLTRLDILLSILTCLNYSASESIVLKADDTTSPINNRNEAQGN